MNENKSFIVNHRIEGAERLKWFLYTDAVYKADPTKPKNKSCEVLSKLVSVKNSGGIRYLGSLNNLKLVILVTTGEDLYWRDDLDYTNGCFLYYGDNQVPGCDLHKTNIHGNEVLKNVFDLAASDRKKVPPILVFKKKQGWDYKFLGLAVPGISWKPQKDWLTAVWALKDGERFQNYKSFFTILDTAKGSAEFQNNYGINLGWITDIVNGHAVDSKFAPLSWVKYINTGEFTALECKAESKTKSKEQQLPSTDEDLKMLDAIHDFFIAKDRGYSFEFFANNITKKMDPSIVELNTTRPYKDGGYDGEGKYRVIKLSETNVELNFYLQAKCFSRNHALGVNDTARLISRIKRREFGIIFTTSYIAKQAYDEILEDQHPIAMITGKTIIDFLKNEMEILNSKTLIDWLHKNYD